MPAYERSVFINCPFDGSFEGLFHAIVLTVVARGFTPRCARDSEGQADPRIVRIARGLSECKYSIHDLSRYQGEGPDNLARFNMPLELGMALSFRYMGDFSNAVTARKHNWIALVPAGFVHQKFISDLAGIDVPDHDQTAAMVIQRAAKWLSIQHDSLPGPSAKAILAAYPDFCKRLDNLRGDALGELAWPEILREAQTAVSAMPVI